MVASYLKDALIEQRVFSYNDFHDLTELTSSLSTAGQSMILFGHTLRNLDVLPSEDNRQYNLFTILDHTSTLFGRRLLKHWLCNPLHRSADIIERQKAIASLNDVSESHGLDLKKSLKKMCDFEKLLAWIFSFCVVSDEHPENEAILYEGERQAKKGIGYLLSCLDGFEAASEILNDLREQLEGDSKLNGLLGRLLPKTDLEDLEKTCRLFKKAFNYKEAKENGKIIPSPGMDPAFDQAQDAMKKVDKEAELYRREQKEFFGTNVTYFGQGPNAFQLEVAESAKKKATMEYTISSQRKGFVRYTTDEIMELREKKTEAEENLRNTLKDVNRSMFRKFYSHKDLWRKMTQTLANLDCLLSLCDYSYGIPDESCFPEPQDDGKPFINITNGRHPLMVASADNMVIPNDLHLDEKIFLLTGANMGGKSTGKI